MHKRNFLVMNQLYTEYKSLQPFKPETLARLNRKFMLEFNYNSNHIEGNTLTYGQTEFLLLFGKTTDVADMKDLEDMKASNVALNMMKEEALSNRPLTENFIRQLHKTLLREDYKVYRQKNGVSTSYTVHAGRYKTRPNSVITKSGEMFEYASPEETPALMSDLLQWYNGEEKSGKLSPAELVALFHYRYIRIHPFEDGNGRIARLLVNFILLRKNYPMIVIKSADKENYLNALSTCDGFTGTSPSEGAHADISKIQPFVSYIEKCLKRALTVCIKAAKGESIEEDEDFVKELKILERQKRQNLAAENSQKQFCETEVWNVLELVFFPLLNEFTKTVENTNSVFNFSQVEQWSLISKNRTQKDSLSLNGVFRDTADSQMKDFVNNAKSMWYICKMQNPQNPQSTDLKIEKEFYITFFDKHYFVDGILNKNFPYGKYPSEEERKEIVSQFKKDILTALKN